MSTARQVIERTFLALAGHRASITVGRLTTLGRGLTRRQFAADVEVSPDPGNLSDVYVVGVPLEANADTEGRLATEAASLELLAGRPFPFRIPRAIRAFVQVPEQSAAIRTYIPGVELDLRSGRQPGVRPWQVVGEIAAALHGASIEPLRGRIPTFASREEFALHQLASLDRGRAHPDVARAIAWAQKHVTPRGEPTLIHGDLLGQNILLAPDDTPALIDWEYSAIADPAYDLAIVTRGVRRPFQIDGGMNKLLEAYGNHGGSQIAASDVHFYEMCLAAGWVCDALATRDTAMIEHAAEPLRALARRLDP